MILGIFLYCLIGLGTTSLFICVHYQHEPEQMVTEPWWGFIVFSLIWPVLMIGTIGWFLVHLFKNTIYQVNLLINGKRDVNSNRASSSD